jgi:circadian clock protein KaiC
MTERSLSAAPRHDEHEVTSAMSEDDRERRAVRVPTRIPGLDTVMEGGLFRGGVYMVMGLPGAGKTILGNQVCFEHVRAGGKAIYLTLLTESHARLISSLRDMEFFEPSFLADRLSYLSGYQALETEGLEGLMTLARGAVKDHQATLLVLDGLVTRTTNHTSDVALKKFIHELQIFVELMGCTTLLLTGARNGETHYAEQTMADGLLRLSALRVGMRAVRELEVLKHRGSPHLLGGHSFEISNSGISVYPRTEASVGSVALSRPPTSTISTGIAKLDEILGGGLMSSSSTLVLGAPGSGRTSLGLHFLDAGARAGQRGLYFGFFEQPDRVRSKAQLLSLPFDDHLRKGLVEILWRAPLEQLADALSKSLLDTVEREGIGRVFIDGLAGMCEGILYPERVRSFVTALLNALQAMGVTTLLADETEQLFGPYPDSSVRGIGSVVDNIIFLRYVELRSQLRRLISVMKVREGLYDSSLREFSIGPNGFLVASTFESAEAILSGLARPILQPTAAKPPRRKRS